jgi:hypothetical protein
MRRQTIILLLGVLTVVFAAAGGMATAKIAYIGYYDTWGANDMKTLLDAQGYATTLVQLCDVGTTDLSGYDLLIVGRDTGDYGEWGNQAGREVIRALDVPILAIFDGGGSLFDQLGVDISCMATATYDEPGLTSMIVENASHLIFRTPNDLSVSDGDNLQLYTEPCPASALYVPPLPEDVVAFGRLPDDTDYAPVALQGRYAYWGFKYTPYNMTQAGKDLFLNIIAYLMDAWA